MLSDRIATGWNKLRAPRRDPSALGFGVAFLVLGVGGLARVAGVDLDADRLCQLALIAVGLAGLVSLFSAGRKPA